MSSPFTLPHYHRLDPFQMGEQEYKSFYYDKSPFEVEPLEVGEEEQVEEDTSVYVLSFWDSDIVNKQI